MRISTRWILSLSIALALGALVAWLSPGSFWAGWLAAGVLLFAAVFALLWLWQRAGGGRLLAVLVSVAFLLRLGLGIAISLGLPIYGYDEPEQKAGYLFFDAYKRDHEAWGLVLSDDSLVATFGREFDTDQYGGLLVLSGQMYRWLSTDAHRPFLTLILAAFAYAFGVPFFYRGVKTRWGPKVAALAAWILVLYPDAILFSASQMREPFLIGLACVAFWGVIAWGEGSRRAAPAAMLGSLAVMTLFSSRIVFAVAGVLAVWFFLDYVYERIPGRWRAAVWAGFGAAGIGLLVLTWDWFASAVTWDLLLITKVSSRWADILSSLNKAAGLVAVSLYGMVRPLLPAAIATVRPPWIWKAIDIFRSAGWYMLIPLLVYSFTAVWKVKPLPQRRTLLWFTAAVILWMVISSLRGGADQWDNPRYRTIFIPWMALLAGWGVQWALAQRDAWLARIVVVEIIFLGFFTQWYLSRYWTWLNWGRWPVEVYVVVIAGLSAAVLVGGWLWDRWRARQRPSKEDA